MSPGLSRRTARGVALAPAPARVAGRITWVVHLRKYYHPATGGIETHTQTDTQTESGLGPEIRVVAVNRADAAGRHVTFDRLLRTPEATDRDGAIVVHRHARLANAAELDACPGVRGLLARFRGEFRPEVWHRNAQDVSTPSGRAGHLDRPARAASRLTVTLESGRPPASRACRLDPAPVVDSDVVVDPDPGTLGRRSHVPAASARTHR